MTTEYRPTQGISSPPEQNHGTDANGSRGQIGKGAIAAAFTTEADSFSVLTYRGNQYGAGVEPDIRVTNPSRSSLMQWFRNLSVGRKQLFGLFTSELLSVIGLVGVGSFLIVSGGRSQLLNQARSELSVANIAYNIKIDQMGFGFRGQSDNQAIINVATADAQGEAVTPESLETVRQILQNEVAARNIEYATLVGRDLAIIASANANRDGQQFDPEGLVGTVLANPRQIKASAIVSWAELQNEQPPLPPGFEGQDALIRYTFTPVKANNSEAIVGVLVSGDIVNGKAAIPQSTLEAFNSGYSAVYQQQADGSFVLASSLKAGDNPDLTEAAANLPLIDESLLVAAAANPDQTVTRRDEVSDTTYTLAASAITNFNDETVGVLVRGVSETPLNQLIANSLMLQLLIALLALAFDVLLAQLLGRSILRPLRDLQQAAWKFGLGDRQSRADIYASDEVGRVAQIFNQLADNVTESEALLVTQSQREKMTAERAVTLADMTSQIRRSLDEETILSTAVERLREVLKADRILIYRFNADFKSGDITAESVGTGWKRAKGRTIEDPLTPEAIERYYTGKVSTMTDRQQAAISHCHCEILERLQVQANMVAPLLAGDELVGLLCVHQCEAPRQWHPEEINLLQQTAVQIGYALSQARLLKQQKLTTEKERQLNDMVLEMRKTLAVEQIYRTAVRATRQVLATDRTVVYLFDETWKGTFVAESVESGYPSALGADIYDPCFADKYVEQYRQGRIQATADLQNSGLTECHLKQLAPYQVKANLVAPIVVEERLIGLLITHQCSRTRQWSDLDINFFRQAAVQLGFALEQARLFTTTEALSEERLKRQETLQMQLVELLSDVEGASSGDLTVRANVTAGEIGTVADFFNAIVESLRQIVTKVKQSAEQVNESIGDNETSIRTLADEALRQADEVTRTLTSVEAMTASIQQVADSARQAAAVASTASSTAETSGKAMDRTVQNILNLRDIIGETSKKVKRLGESSQQISKVVSLINQIAMQTNLLAINAGIEAARAGEEGQGFAVVAEEVGELAARSADATQEIERIVETIQRETVEVVEAMEQSTSEVVAGTHLVEDAKQNFNRILEVSRQIDQLVQSISEATVSQVEVSETVTKLMQEIAQVSERTSSSSLEITSSLRRTVEVSQALQASVGTFKTGE